jgi:hypothetical protein
MPFFAGCIEGAKNCFVHRHACCQCKLDTCSSHSYFPLDFLCLGTGHFHVQTSAIGFFSIYMWHHETSLKRTFIDDNNFYDKENCCLCLCVSICWCRCDCVCDQIESSVGGDNCYEVKSKGVKDQVLEVLSAFNIYVTQQDVFSRCQVSLINNSHVLFQRLASLFLLCLFRVGVGGGAHCKISCHRQHLHFYLAHMSRRFT